VLIRLRRSGLLADHSARVPITIQTLAGKGMLRRGARSMSLCPASLFR